jgi:hypothetical protein
MKKVNFRNSVIAMAISLVMVSCGGGNSSKKQADNLATEAEKKAESVVAAKNVSSGWESNEYTKLVPKPEIAINAAGESSMGYSADFNKPTLEQVKAYVEKVKAAGFNVGAYESNGDMYSYTAKNADGWKVLISWSQGQSGVLISKPR